MMILTKAGISISAVGADPTAAEIGTAMALNTTSKAFVIYFNQGKLTAGDKQTYTGADTFDTLPTIYEEKMMLTGEITDINAAFENALKQFGVNKRCQLRFVDSEGYIHGGAAGFKAAINFEKMPAMEFGKRPTITFSGEFKINPAATTTDTKDLAYLLLNNA